MEATHLDAQQPRWEVRDETDLGWVRQYETWEGDGLYLVVEEAHFAPSPLMYGQNESWGLGLARKGAYRRQVRGADQIVDANTGFLRYDGDEVGREYFTGEPIEMTYIGADPGIVRGWFDKVSEFPMFTVTPAMELAHLRLIRAERRGADKLTLESLALDLLNAAISQHDENVNSYARRSTGESRRRLVTETCELMHAKHAKIGLVEIARTIGCSPFHLSRVFHEITDLTIPQYRKRLCIHEALRRLNDGEEDLATIAMASGFADHSHMTRSFVGLYGDPPSRLRQLLQLYADTARLVPR